MKSRVDGQEFLVPNERFGYRFFPPGLARTPPAFRIPAKKTPGTYRIFVFGESAALGSPDTSFGVSRYLEVLLDERYPDTEFEVICAAMTAINSHVILPIAREMARLNGDLWMIYMGNNEMVGPFGAGTIFGTRAPGPGFVRTSIALQKTRLGQLMASLASKAGSTARVPDQWEGINMFKKTLLRHDDPGRLRAYGNFERNLEDILQTGREAGVPILLSTVGSNLKDCSPFASLHRKELDASGKLEWDRLFERGMELEKAGYYEDALSQYRQAETIDSEYAEIHYRMGICQLAIGQSESARQAFVQARDYDALAVRADSRINRILMAAIPESKNHVTGIDAAEALCAQSPDGISGEAFFYEHVHFTVEGNYALARMLADQIRELLPPETLDAQTENWLDNKACNRQLALSLWSQTQLWLTEAERIHNMPYSSQTSHSSNKKHIEQKLNELQARITQETWAMDNQLYLSALDQAPNDTVLIYNYAKFLDATGKSAKAVEQVDRYCSLLPDLAWPHLYRARVLAKAGRREKAKDSLRKALEIRSEYTEARELLKQIQ